MSSPIAQDLRRVVALAVAGEGGAYWATALEPAQVLSQALDELQRPDAFPGSRLFIVRVSLGSQPLAQAVLAAVQSALDDEGLAERVSLDHTARALAWLGELPPLWRERAVEHVRETLGADVETLARAGRGEEIVPALTQWASQVGLEFRAPAALEGQLELLHDLLCYSCGFRALVVAVAAPDFTETPLREVAALAELRALAALAWRLHLALVVASHAPPPPELPAPPELAASDVEPGFQELGEGAPSRPTLVDPLRRASPGAPDLRSALRRLAERASAVRESLDELALALSDAPEPEADRLLADLLELADRSPDAVHEAARALFGDAEGTEAALERLAVYERIAGRMPPLVRTHRVLAGLALPPDDPLALDAATLRGRFTVASLLASPSTSAALLADCEAFERMLGKRYAEHHGAVAAEMAELHGDLAAAAERAEALRKLNATSALGPPEAEEALTDFDALRASVAPCPQELDVSDPAIPCPDCGLTFADRSPRDAVEACLKTIDAGLAAQLRRLSHRAVREVLRRDGGDALAAFLEIVQVADLSALPGVLTDEVCAHLERLLAEPPDP